MDSSPVATMSPPPVPSSRARNSLLFGSFSLPSGWGCRRPMAFSRDNGVSEPEPNTAAAAEKPQNKLPNRRRKEPRAEEARPLKKLGNTETPGKKSRGFSVTLTRQEIEADFVAMTGRKPPRKVKKTPKSVQCQIEIFLLVRPILTVQFVLPLPFAAQDLLPWELAGGGYPRSLQGERGMHTNSVFVFFFLFSPRNLSWRFEVMIDSSPDWSRMGDSELREGNGGGD
ncbi:hypothetical protein EJB05_36576, partial [Eragrostis curvula]